MTSDKKHPVLIIGSGRSGTTFLAKLLDSSPDVLYRHEPDFSHVNSEIPFLVELDDLEKYKKQASQYYGDLLCERSWKTAARLPVFPKNYRSRFEKLLYEIIIYASKLPYAKKMLPPQIPDLLARNANPVYVIKSVNSICRAALFLEAIPDLKVIHIVRHPCAVISSLIEGHVKGLMANEVYMDALFSMRNINGYGISYEMMESFSKEEKVAFQWMVMNNKIADEAGKYSSRYMRVHYEELCHDVAGQTKKIYDHCGLNWNAQTQDFIDRMKNVDQKKASYFSVNRNPKSAIFKWRGKLPVETQAKIIELVSGSDVGRQTCSTVQMIEDLNWECH